MTPGRLRIRTRIAVGSLLIAVLLAVPSGLVLDAQIRHIVRLGTGAVLKSDQDPYAADIRAGRTSAFDTPGPSAAVAVVAPDGSRPLDTLPRAVRGALAVVVRDDETRAVTVGGRSYLVRSEAVVVGGSTWYVVASRDGSSEQATLDPMRLLLIGVLVAVVVGVGIGAWVLAAASLRPVSRLRRTASRLSTSEGHELLPVGSTDDEIARLATTLNVLISRLRDTADRERRLVSDASHELRTPVAVIRTQLELARSGDGDAAALRRDIAVAESGAVRLAGLLDSLLELSSIQARAHAAGCDLADLEDEVRDAIGRAAFRGGADAVAVRLEADTASSVHGTVAVAAPDVGRIVDNLLSNSIAALSGAVGRILVALTVDETEVRLAVSDDAGGLPLGMERSATERFTRGPDAARGAGAGLGLAIVAALVDAAEGTLSLDNRAGEGLTVTLTLPIRRDGR